MKYLAMIVIGMSLVSCATPGQQKEALHTMVKMEADCKTVSDIQASDFQMVMGSGTRFINATCDGKRIRCKQSVKSTGSSILATDMSVSCKERT